ncbi:putative serine/threonine-protein kinase PIX13 [Cinnamomum micranthum f. kanehirae]|uniref:non-specific serine/threonine protein kinase n=1 Tax=Cinnamomum micranthum f. kanehirae TaxID=337451 RepID=A0A443NJ64_9MAGN|nr:putative serine/threonine-protein kinase PIX13 [Cinnamomum micranthum f. kanehirae]
MAAMDKKIDMIIKAMASNSMQGQTPKEVCAICSHTNHATECCPMSSFTDQEHTNYVGNTFPKQNNPYSNTYNSGWRNHPNFSWGGNQNNQNNQGNQGNQNQYQGQQRSYQYPQNNNFSHNSAPKPPEDDFKSLVTQFIQSSQANFQQHSQAITNTQQSLAKLEAQMGQIANALSKREDGKFPSQTEINPKNQEHLKAITTLTIEPEKVYRRMRQHGTVLDTSVNGPHENPKTTIIEPQDSGRQTETDVNQKSDKGTDTAASPIPETTSIAPERLQLGIPKRGQREMGNFWIAQFDSSSSSSPSSTRPSSPGIAQNTSNERTHSETGSAFSSRLDEVSPYGQILPITPTLRIFSFAELKAATGKFSPDRVPGEVGFGRVFKGWIDEKTFAPTKAGRGMAIAVKKLNSDDFHGRKEWQSEVNILGNLSHPNIVRLLGHCEEDKELLLVYEFMPGGSLGSHLFSRGSAFQALSWSIRIKIALGVARGLAFLHCSERKIIHRNLTPYNVLIDSNYDAKISDFGLARNGPQGENSHVSPDVMGTYGYVAPEYVATGHLYVEIDVYSFGVVLLVMLSGHQALDPNRPSGQHDLVDWAKPYLSDERKVSQWMDRRLEGQYPSKGAVLAAQLILACLNSDRRKRPSMTEVVEALEQIQAIKHKAYAPITKN